MNEDLTQARNTFKKSWNGLWVPEWHEPEEEPDIALRSEDYDIMLDGLAKFAANPDVVRVWEFSPETGALQGLQFPQGASRIADTGCWVVCPFVSGKLIIHSPVALRAGFFTLWVGHSVLFDSNLYDMIVRFVESPETLSSSAIDRVRRLIQAIVDRRYDYQFVPYVIETYAKNPNETGDAYAFRATLAILRLHTMDKGYFRATGQVRVDNETLALYEPEFGTTNLQDIARAQLDTYGRVSTTPTAVELTLLALIRMVLIRRVTMANRPFDTQFAAFDDFVFGEVGAVLANLRNVAILYFAGELDRWIRVQRRMNPAKALASLSNCAWDLHLANVYQQILGDSPDNQAMLCHFCTRESELARLLAHWPLRFLRVMRDGTTMPGYEASMDVYASAIGKGWEKSMQAAYRRLELFIERRKSGEVRRIAPSGISQLLADATEDFMRMIQT